jgi:hypothetical protein
MNFSEIIPGVTSGLYSPDDNYIAVTNGHKLLVINYNLIGKKK